MGLKEECIRIIQKPVTMKIHGTEFVKVKDGWVPKYEGKTVKLINKKQ